MWRIYFGTLLETVKDYGKNIVKVEINHKKFVDSRADISIIGKIKIVNLLKALHKEDVKGYHFEQLFNNIKQEQIRNFQIEMAQKFGTENFVKAWNKYIKLDETFQVQDKSTNNIWYAIMNTDIKLTKI